MQRKKPIQLPKQGEAFAVPLEDGRYSVCRVILDQKSEAAKFWKGECVLVACSAWIGNEIPNANNEELRPILSKTHHSWGGRLEILWIADPVPNEFIPIGKIPPNSEEFLIHCGTLGGWSNMSLHPLIQWRWDHDRESLVEEDKLKAIEEQTRQKQVQAAREAYLASVSLNELLTHQFFLDWKVYTPAKAIRASQKLMVKTVQRLLELGESASELDRIEILKSCIESFNELDEKLGFIETVERDDICEEFEAIVHACGLGHHKDLADNWREW